MIGAWVIAAGHALHCVAVASSAPRVSPQVTGPVALMEATEAYSRNTGRNVTVLAPGLVFAYNWHQASTHPLRTSTAIVDCTCSETLQQRLPSCLITYRSMRYGGLLDAAVASLL